MAFVHLHVHSEYSLLDGACRIPDLIARVKDLGQTAVAVTDHDESGEAERTAALVGLRHTVDRQDAIEHLVLVIVLTTATAVTAATFATTVVAAATTLVVVAGLGGCLSVLSLFRHLGFLFVVAHSARPPSRAPSATAATRP